MLVSDGQIFRCTNPRCNCERMVVNPPEIDGRLPMRCFCGSEMKRPYKEPVLRRLEEESIARVRKQLLRKASFLGRLR
jgi:hypothetical protein